MSFEVMPKTPARPRRKKVAAASLGLAAADAALVDGSALDALAATVVADGGAVLARFRDPVGGKPLVLARLPVERVEPTPYPRDASEAHVKRLMGVVETIGLFLDPKAAGPADDE
jgi:ParB family chromosome partitioning protein